MEVLYQIHSTTPTEDLLKYNDNRKLRKRTCFSLQFNITLISSSCISRNSNFLLLSETESSDGNTVPTVSTTSSGREDSVATTASSGFILPDTVKALKVLPNIRMQARVVITLEGNINQTYLESMRSEDGTA